MPVSLTLLPAEVQHLVWTQLCHHCTGTATGAHRVDAFIANREGLRSLTETCSTLRDSVQPFLYHWIDNYVNLNSLVRQLIDRPDLAEHVKELACFGSLPPMDIWRQLAKKLHLIEGEDAQFMKPADVGTRSIFYTLELLLALLPNVKMATMWANRKRNPLESGVALDCLATRTAYLAPKPCLPNLRALTLTNMLEYERLELDPDAVPILFNAAPNLHHLTLSQCYGITTEVSDLLCPSSLRKLKILELDGYPLKASPLDECEYEQTQDLVALCPDVEDIRVKPCGVAYWDNNDEFQAFSPLKLLESLGPAKNTLRRLTLDTSLATTYPDVESLGPTLANFTVLSTLTLEEQTFCHHWFVGPLHRPLAHDPPLCLTGILPQSVERLNIILNRETKVIQDIIHLGKGVQDGQFAALKAVTIMGCPVQKRRQPLGGDDRTGWFSRHRADILAVFQGTEVTVSFYLVL